LAGIIYGRRMYEVMRYWDDDQPDWDAVERDFATSRLRDSVARKAEVGRVAHAGAFVRALKAKLDGEIDVSGPKLAGGLTALGLIDEYHLYFRPFILGGGKPFFAGTRPPLRFVSAETVGEDAVRLTLTAITIAAKPHPKSACQLQRSLAGRANNRHFFCQAVTQEVFLLLQIKSRLEVEPKALGSAKVARQTQGSVGCDSASPVDNLIDPSRGNTDVLGDSILRNPHWLEKVAKQNLARVNRRKLSSGHKRFLVIVYDLNIMGVAVLPAEADAPLVIDANAVLAAPSALELLQPIGWRHSQIAQRFGRVQSAKFSQHCSQYIRRETPYRLAVEQALRVPIREAFDHSAT
jgi:dihydrofolate reductase